VITVCKNCGAALNETVETCPDCGVPNSWYDEASKNPRGWGDMLFGLFGKNAPIERSLLLLGVLDLFVALVGLFSDAFVSSPGDPIDFQAHEVGAAVLGVGGLALAFYSDLERPLWRAIAKGIVAVNVLGFLVLIALN
jgi:hypothetical protein